MARQQPEQQPPPVQRVRLKFARRGRLRFTSHRDFSRAFERALRRARVPVALSSGFNPHPRISYSGAAPTGAASEAEYLEIALAEVVDPDQVRDTLDEALPPGLDILDAVVSAGGSLADQLQASHWRIELRGITESALVEAIAGFLAAPEVPISRMTKKGERTFDARAAVVSLESRILPEEPTCAILDLVLRHETPAVRPDDVLAALEKIAEVAPSAVLLRRIAQGPLDQQAGTVGDPFSPDRDAAPGPATAVGEAKPS